jgi:hypothetical protein
MTMPPDLRGSAQPGSTGPAMKRTMITATMVAVLAMPGGRRREFG